MWDKPRQAAWVRERPEIWPASLFLAASVLVVIFSCVNACEYRRGVRSRVSYMEFIYQKLLLFFMNLGPKLVYNVFIGGVFLKKVFEDTFSGKPIILQERYRGVLWERTVAEWRFLHPLRRSKSLQLTKSRNLGTAEEYSITSLESCLYASFRNLCSFSFFFFSRSAGRRHHPDWIAWTENKAYQRNA